MSRFQTVINKIFKVLCAKYSSNLKFLIHFGSCKHNLRPEEFQTRNRRQIPPDGGTLHSLDFEPQ